MPSIDRKNLRNPAENVRFCNFTVTDFKASIRFSWVVGLKSDLQTLHGCDFRAWKQTLPDMTPVWADRSHPGPQK